MSTKIILLTSLIAFSNAISAKPIFTETEDQNLVKTIVTPAFQNPIHPGDLSTSATPQFTIKNSGRYYLSNHLSVANSNASATVLLINASNVSLDLNAKTITPQGSMSTGVGIGVTQGLSNILVHNGYIYGSDLSSQKLNTGIDLNASGSGTSYQIKLQDLQISRCKVQGLLANTVNDLIIENCQCNDASGSGAVYGAFLTTVNNLKIKNCEFSGNATSSAASTVYGLNLTSCTDGIIENVVCAKNNASSTSTCTGAYLSSCTNITLRSVATTDNSAAGATCYGINLTGSTNNQLVNCVANGNSSSASGSSVAGIYLQSSSHNCLLDNCLANNNANSDSAGAGTAYGIRLASSNALVVNNCQANGNTVASGGATARVVAGMSLETVLSSTINNCQASSNKNSNTTAASHTYGVYLSSSTDNTFTKCTASSNDAAAASATCAGFYSSTGTNNRFDSCIANRNRNTNTGASITCAGFYFAGAETSSQIIGCESAHNMVGDTTSSASTARAYGIYFSGNAANCSVKYCYLAYNTKGSSGSGKAFGFYDASSTSTTNTLLIGNIAVGQGSCLGTTLLASLSWNGNNEPTSDQNYFFQTNGTGDDPRNMISEVPHQNFNSISTAIVKWQNISVY